MKKFLLLALTLGTLVGCAAPRYSGSSIEPGIMASSPNVAVVKDRETREGFLAAVESWLRHNNYQYTVIPEGSKFEPDDLTLEYVGYWRWDLALFLHQADIKAHFKGQQVGTVNFEAPNNMSPRKFGNAEERIGYMLDVLFGKISAAEATSAIDKQENLESTQKSEL
ncbi:MAG: Sbal_3080 family lipoprotein [Nitrospirota bacterium]|nr:Sbal_3080 family lipoprotein [Nitrospirota bacterium]